jgi:hypothetical protein
MMALCSVKKRLYISAFTIVAEQSVLRFSSDRRTSNAKICPEER